MLLRPSVRRWYDNPFYCPDLSPQKEKMPTPRGRLGRGDAGDARGRGRFWEKCTPLRSVARTKFLRARKNFPEVFCWRKGGSVNKVLSVYNKTAYSNEKNRRTASPPTVFMVYGLPCAGMKIGCHGGADKGRFGLLMGNRLRQGLAKGADKGGSVC